MRRVVVFVEGQTELIFVRELLLRWYVYSVNIECLQFLKGGNLGPAPYSFTSPNADVYFLIINVGNDQKVLSAILDREKSLFDQGFERIVGLRDMYCKSYRDRSNVINTQLNQEIIDEISELIEDRPSPLTNIYFCFSIMEVEAWFLGMHQIFTRVNAGLTHAAISNELQKDISQADPESEFFHPAATVTRIYELAQLRYDKHLGDVEGYCTHMTAEDLVGLNQSARCASYSNFLNALII
jgi:hypothetical protein